MTAGVNAVGEQLQAGHVGAGPADARKRPEQGGAPEAVGEEGETQMTGEGQADAEQIDSLGVNPIGRCDQNRNGDGVGQVEQAGYPSCLAVAEAPFRHHARQESRPGVGADLRQNLRRAYQNDEADRRHRACPYAAISLA